MRVCTLFALAGAIAAGWSGAAASHQLIEPQIIETRLVDLTQTVTLHDIPAEARTVRMWVPVPSDAPWQRVLECNVLATPKPTKTSDTPGWQIVQPVQGQGRFIFVEFQNTGDPSASITFHCTVQRQGVHFPLEQWTAAGPMQPALFAAELDPNAPLMEVDQRIRTMADTICGNESDPARQTMLLLRGVADAADHYSKDPTKPKCGRGSAGDCLDHGGGCCTDIHSLFIALARARGIPARIQFGYRLLESKAGTEFDPGYRCWTEFFIPGAGWIPTDVVAADAVDDANPLRWASLSAARVWLWQGRSFELTPADHAGRIDTMLCGWAEIDGRAVDPLPAADGTPSKLRRTVKFTLLKKDRAPDAPNLPE
jgi:transglutaminase-like putative cysteine protease